MKKQGFTLIELLAVIVILAVIALIATPLIMGTITKAKKNAFKDTAYGILKAGENYTAEKLLTNESNSYYGELIELPGKNKINYKGTDDFTGELFVSPDGKLSLAIHNQSYCAIKNYDEMEVKVIDYKEEQCAFKATGYYVKDGLLLNLDGVDNGGDKIHLENNSASKEIWKDLSGKGNDCKLEGFEYSDSSGWKENGLLFDGVDDTCLSNSLTPNQFTLSLVVNPTSKGKRHVIFTRWYGYTLEIIENGVIWFGMYPNSSNYLQSKEKIKFGEKQYISATFNGSEMKIYLNGKQIAYQKSDYLNYSKNHIDNTMLSANYYDTFQGTIHHAMMYDRALSLEEIMQNYQSDKLRYAK